MNWLEDTPEIHKGLALTKTPNGRRVQDEPPPWEPELETPEEGCYEWHLQRAKNTSVVGWLAYGTSCAEIRDKKLYEPHFDSWGEFCRVELHQSQSQVNREIKGASLALELEGAGCHLLPICERQVRPLGLLRVPILRIQAWNNACAMKSPGFTPTAVDVQRAVRKLMPIPATVNIASLRKLKKELARSRASLNAALKSYSEPDIVELLTGAAGLKDRRLISKLIDRQRQLLSRFNVETKILL